MVQSLPGFLDLCLDVCNPCQVPGDVYTEVLEAAHPLHGDPTDHKECCVLLHIRACVYLHMLKLSVGHCTVQLRTLILAPTVIFKFHKPFLIQHADLSLQHL